MAELELQPDEKQQQHQPDLTQDREHPVQRGIEQSRSHSRIVRLGMEHHAPVVREKATENRRPQKQTGGNFPHHAGLAKPPKQQGRHPGDQEDDPDLDHDRQQHVFDVHLSQRGRLGCQFD
jgi:hypothetical protein